MYFIAGVDYEPVNVALTFTPSTQSQTINIVTLEDGMYEADGQPERICLRITKLSEPCPDSSIIGDDVIVLIAEDDRKFIMHVFIISWV